MKEKEFEQAVLSLVRTTRVPLTRENVAFYTGLQAKQAERWLDHLVAEGTLDLETDDEGEIVYVATSTARPEGGATELARCPSCGRATAIGTRCTRCGKSLDQRLLELRGEIERAGTALTLWKHRTDLLVPQREGDKSLLIGALLGLFGPLGWLYAAPLREAIPAAILFVLVLKLIPAFVLIPLLFGLLPILPASALIGALYAWKYNRTGRRSGLLTEDTEKGRKGKEG